MNNPEFNYKKARRFKTGMWFIKQILLKLGDHWSVHLTCRGLCDKEVWKLIRAICTMQGSSFELKDHVRHK